MQKILEKFANPLIFIIAAAFLRLVPHAPNFAPIGAMALFAGSYLDRKTAFILPLSAMVLSDLFIGFDSLSSRVTVYGSFVLITLLGVWLKHHRSAKNVILASFCASALFFIVTNFGVWLTGTLYSKDLNGLVACYSAAIPFFRNTLAGDLFYSGIFFGGYELLKATSVGKLATLRIGVKNGRK
jgi:hypothetical protein